MPLYIIIVITIIVFVEIISVTIHKGKIDWFSKKRSELAVFILSAISFCITFSTFINIAQYVDESGASPYAVYGGKLGLYSAWIGLGVIFLICIISGFRLIKHPKDDIMRMAKKDLD